MGQDPGPGERGGAGEPAGRVGTKPGRGWGRELSEQQAQIPVSLCFQGTGVLACLRGVWDGGDTGAEVSEVVAEA